MPARSRGCKRQNGDAMTDDERDARAAFLQETRQRNLESLERNRRDLAEREQDRAAREVAAALERLRENREARRTAAPPARHRGLDTMPPDIDARIAVALAAAIEAERELMREAI